MKDTGSFLCIVLLQEGAEQSTLLLGHMLKHLCLNTARESHPERCKRIVLGCFFLRLVGVSFGFRGCFLRGRRIRFRVTRVTVHDGDDPGISAVILLVVFLIIRFFVQIRYNAEALQGCEGCIFIEYLTLLKEFRPGDFLYDRDLGRKVGDLVAGAYLSSNFSVEDPERSGTSDRPTPFSGT